MDQAFDTLFKLDKRAVAQHIDHLTGDLRANRISLFDVVPGAGLYLLQSQGDALSILVDLEHFDVDFLIDLQQFTRVVHPSP